MKVAHVSLMEVKDVDKALLLKLHVSLIEGLVDVLDLLEMLARLIAEQAGQDWQAVMRPTQRKH
jgi:hypothetical protein